MCNVCLSCVQVVNREVMIEEAMGKQMKAIVVFSMAIKYLKDQCMSLIRARGLHVRDDDVMWVLSVPAIWEEPAKQFMREAAVMVKCLVIIMIDNQ